jgi:hypothetical protein
VYFDGDLRSQTAVISRFGSAIDQYRFQFGFFARLRPVSMTRSFVEETLCFFSITDSGVITSDFSRGKSVDWRDDTDLANESVRAFEQSITL